MKGKEDKKTPSPDFIFIENMSGVAACCTRCLTCRNTCKQVLKVDEVKCCGCKLCVCGGGVRLQNEEAHIKSCFLYIYFIEIGDKE